MPTPIDILLDPISLAVQAIYASLIALEAVFPARTTAEWLARLFDQEKDPVSLIKWKEIYDTLEKTLDQAEDVANILESIAIKHS